MTDNSSELDHYWSQPTDSLLKALHSAPDGLSTIEAKRCLEQFGPNVLEAKEKATSWPISSPPSWLNGCFFEGPETGDTYEPPYCSRKRMKGIDWRHMYWLVVGVLLTGCGAWQVSMPQPEVALTITGKVAISGTWDADRLQSLGLMKLVTIQPSGEEVIWEGVLLKDLLHAVEPGPDASKVIFTNSNGDRVEMPLNEAQACKECLVAFDPIGSGVHLAMPGLPAELWVRNLVGIELQ